MHPTHYHSFCFRAGARDLIIAVTRAIEGLLDGKQKASMLITSLY
jgi:hypothetical protein